MVKAHRHTTYPLVYQLIELTFTLPIATATLERVFSAMKIIKSYLRNRMEDKWFNDNMVVYIEKSIFVGVDDEVILKRYQHMQNGMTQLSFIKSSSKDITSIDI
ncbi:hypothetical protein OROGR_025342 [Orobanche gracilis]